jgi:hypothetical protein
LLADGAHTFEVRATDPAGNVDATPASRGFTVDTSAPDTTIDSGPAGLTNDSTPTFGFSANQASSTFECRVDGGAWSSCSTPHTTATLADGAHTFEARATDPAGNTDPTPAQRAFVVESGQPDTTIDSGPSGPTSDATPLFVFSADELGSTFECRVDGGAWGLCLPSDPLALLADGTHTFEVRATDLAGNVDQTPAGRTFTIDTNPPDSNIDTGPSGTTADPTPTFTVSSSQPGSTYECRIDGGAWSVCSSTFTAGNLPDGPHTFEVRAIDAAGNVDPTPAGRPFTVAVPAANNPPVGGVEPSGNPPATPAPSSPAPPAPVPTTPSQAGADLSSLRGSLVGERSCQRLGAGLRTKRMKLRGIGRVTVRIVAPAIVMADEPLTVSITGPKGGKGRLRSVQYALDGRRVRGAGRQPFALAIKPANLARVGRHALAMKLKPKKGAAKTVKLGMRTFPCTTVFRAYQKRAGAATQLKLRIDARKAVAGTTFNVPGKMLPKGKAGLKVGTLRVVSTSSSTRAWGLAFGAKPGSGIVLGAGGAPAVTVRGAKVTVDALPAGTGIVEVYLNAARSARPSALVKRGRSAKLGATVGSERLSYKLRGR